MKKIIRLTASLALAAIVAVPTFAARGSANFTRYVALGTSYGAGVENSSLVLSHQPYSYPAIIAHQAGLRTDTGCIGQTTNAKCWQIPFVSEPGIGPELVLTSLSPLVIAPKATTNGGPINLSLPRPYNNLSIPGARVNDLITLTGKETPDNTQKQFAQFILRGLGTAADQALALQPTFISVEIGGNDVLGAVLAGTPAVLTPLADFRRDYEALLTKLTTGAPNAGMVAMGVADVTALPYATTLKPVLINPATQQPVLNNGQPIFLVAEQGPGLPPRQLTTSDLVLLGASSFLSTGYGIPAALAPAFPTLPNVGKPLPDAVVLTSAEIATIQTRVNDVNAAINEIASAKSIPVVNLGTTLTKLRTTGLNYGGVTITGAFVTGGFFSLDGFHPTDIGYTILANEFIKVINANYGTHIPQASIAQFFANNAPSSTSLVLPGDVTASSFTSSAYKSLLNISGVTPATEDAAPRRGRGVVAH